MSPERNCPDCGAMLPADAPRGLCPECLMGAACSRTSISPFTATGAFELTGQGILATIAQNIGSVPRVLLRGTDGAAEPPVVRLPGRADADHSIRYRIDKSTSGPNFHSSSRSRL